MGTTGRNAGKVFPCTSSWYRSAAVFRTTHLVPIFALLLLFIGAVCVQADTFTQQYTGSDQTESVQVAPGNHTFAIAHIPRNQRQDTIIIVQGQPVVVTVEFETYVRWFVDGVYVEIDRPGGVADVWTAGHNVNITRDTQVHGEIWAEYLGYDYQIDDIHLCNHVWNVEVQEQTEVDLTLDSVPFGNQNVFDLAPQPIRYELVWDGKIHAIYYLNTPVEIHAQTPVNGRNFEYWTGTDILIPEGSWSNPISVVMDKDRQYTAHYVDGANTAPAVDAGPDLTVTLPAQATVDATVTDDGLPDPPGAVTVAWSKVSGPGTVTFADPASTDTTAGFSVAGTYVLRLTADDGDLTAHDEVTITVDLPEGCHPADTNADWSISADEAQAYGDAWRQGNDWSIAPPTSIPIDYATRAGYLAMNGGAYQYDAGIGPPLCWKSISSRRR